MKISLACRMLVAVFALTLAGCATTQVANELNGQKLTDDRRAEPIAHLSGSNWGIYLTPAIPLISGNTRYPDYWFPITLFRDNVSVPAVTEMVTAKSADLGGTRSTDVTSQRSSIWIVPIPFLWYKSVTVTANSTK